MNNKPNKIQNKNIRKLNEKKKINRPNSLDLSKNYNNNNKKLNKIIHINLFQLPIESISKEFNDIKKIVLKNENSKEIIEKDKVLIKNANINITKEKIIMSLKRELNFHKLMNKNLLYFKEYADKNSNLYKKNYEDICKYRIQLHDDLSDFFNLIANYEKMKVNYENEKDEMIKTNENLIQYKLNEQNQMKERLEKLNQDIKTQYKTIDDLTITIEEYIKKHKDNNINIEKKEFEYDDIYDMLINKYKSAENEYRYYFNMEMRKRKNKLDVGNKSLCSEEEGMALLKLSEKEVKGEFLKNIIRDIQMQIQDIEQINKKINNNKDLEKLLGKRGAEKYKQRIKEKYNNQVNNIKMKNK